MEKKVKIVIHHFGCVTEGYCSIKLDSFNTANNETLTKLFKIINSVKNTWGLNILLDEQGREIKINRIFGNTIDQKNDEYIKLDITWNIETDIEKLIKNDVIDQYTYAFIGKAALYAGINFLPGCISNNYKKYFTVERFNNNIIIKVPKENMGRWIGKGGNNIRKLSEIIDRKIKVIC